MVLQVRVDPNDQTKIAIECADVAATSSGPHAPSDGAGDPPGALERLAQLREACALTEPEFVQAKTAILGA